MNYQEIIESLLQEKMQLKTQRATLMDEVRILDEDLSKINKMLRAAGHEEVDSGKKKTATAKRKPPGFGEKAQENLKQIIRLLADNPMTTAEITEHFSFSKTRTNQLLIRGRELGLIRKFGARGNAVEWAIFPDSVSRVDGD